MNQQQFATALKTVTWRKISGADRGYTYEYRDAANRRCVASLYAARDARGKRVYADVYNLILARLARVWNYEGDLTAFRK